MSLSDTTYNSVATYFCDSGYDLIGNDTRTCLETGNWSNEKPTCTSKLDSQTVVLIINHYRSFKGRSSTGGSDDISVYIVVGVCGTIVVVITSVICVTLCLKKRKSKAKNTHVMTLSDSIAYTVTSTSSNDKEADKTYGWLSTTERNDFTSQNEAYEMNFVVPVSTTSFYGTHY